MANLPSDIILYLIQSHFGTVTPDVLKNLSQVSQTWRQIALSPIQWAKALDFEALRLKKDVWRTEVLRRTGDCPIEVNKSWIPSVIQDFFLHEFLVHNIYRIKILQADIGLMTNKAANDPAWSVIYEKPAPVLEIFTLDFNAHHEQGPPRAILDAIADGKVLFAGHSPALHTSNGNPCLIYNLGTQPSPASDWLSNLTTIMLSENSVIVLNVLSLTPRLKRLFLTKKSPQWIDDLPQISSVSLPHLEYLFKDRIYNDDSFTTIHSAIKAPPSMSFFIAPRDTHCVPKIMTMFRGFIEETRPKKILMYWPSFRLSHFATQSRSVDVNELLRDSSRNDFAIEFDPEWTGGDPALPLKALMDSGVELSSVQEWCIQWYDNTTRWIKEGSIAVFEEFLTKALRPGQALYVNKKHREKMETREYLLKHPVELIEDDSSGDVNDR